MNNNDFNELKRLNFENFLWVIFAFICLINVYGDELQKEYIYSHSDNYETQSNYVFTFTLIVTFFIYIYFFLRNYNSYKKATSNEKKMYEIKILGSSFLIAGVICLIYFQINNKSFIGSPSL